MLLRGSPRLRLPQATLILPSPDGRGTAMSTNTAAGVANQGYYQPFWVPYSTRLVSMSFNCLAGTNNHDLALLDAAGNRLISRGSTATTASVVNTWTLGTPWPVEQGQMYWAAFSTAGTKTVTNINPQATAAWLNVRRGFSTQAIGAVAIPNPVTFGAFSGITFMPIIKLVFAW